MNYSISCIRCGCTTAIAPDTARDWDEINCTDCGEFITTCGYYRDRQAPNYVVQAFNMSCSLVVQMSREHVEYEDDVSNWALSA